MLKIIVFLSVLAFASAWKPGKLHREYWNFQLMATNLLNLTQHLCKDALLKLRMADHIQETYKYSLAYELGLLASGIMDKFKHMLRIYRYYSNHYDFKRSSHSIHSIMNGYSNMQSDYNEIRAERDLYLDVLDKHMKKRAEEDRRIEIYAQRNPGMSAQAIKDARDRGVKPPPGFIMRRAMMNMTGKITVTNSTKTNSMQFMPIRPGNKTEITRTINPAEEEYKKKLRYMMWAKKWRGFNPETEGVDIPLKIANVGLANASNFLVKELKGVV